MKLNYKRLLSFIIFISACTTIIFIVFPNVFSVFQRQFYSLSIDPENFFSLEAQYLNAQKSLPSFPFEYWQNNTKKHLQLNKTCAKFPSGLDVEFQNLYWQNLRSKYGHYQLFGAYLDDRPANPLGPTVRILAMVDQVEPLRVMYCQLWFHERKEPAIVNASKYNLAWHKGFGNHKTGIYQPYLIPCQIPSGYHNLTVAAVSLVENYCDTASNVLRVFCDKPLGEKQDFAICVKGMDFMLEDISSVVTEWIEMMGLLGVHKIFMYSLQMHPHVSKVLKHYESLGRVEVVPLTLPAGQPNTPFWQHIYLDRKTLNKWQGEIIPYNDCFYRHMYQYKYIVLVDVDEVIVPKNGTTWTDLFNVLNQKLKKKHDSFNVRNVYFFTDLLLTHNWFEDVPGYMHILNHVYRDPNILKAGINIKSFHSTETILSLHNHFPISCLGRGCINYPVDPNDALMHHYKRKPIERYTKFRQGSIVDTTIWKYKKPLIERVTRVLKDLGFLVLKKLN